MSRRAILSRRSWSISDFWWALARLVKGKDDRLRARRIRLETTMSDSGPVPRSLSPLDWVRLSRFIDGFLLLYQIAQPGGFLVGLRIDSTTEGQTQVAQLGLCGGML